MFSVDDGLPLAIVKGGPHNGEIIFISDEEPEGNLAIVKSIPLKEGVFQLIPNDKLRVHYVAGPAGSGKSTWTSNYCKQQRKLCPDCKIILFSRVEDDPAFKYLTLNKINLDDPQLVTNPIALEDVTKNSIVIFDDIDTIANKKLMESLINFQSQLLEMGRHRNIKCLITSHLINGNNRKQTRTILNEMHTLTIFPKMGASYAIRYCLNKHFDLSHKETSKLLKYDCRYVTFIKYAPQIVMTENCIKFISEI